MCITLGFLESGDGTQGFVLTSMRYQVNCISSPKRDFFFFETESLVAHAGLKFTKKPRMTMNFGSLFPSARVLGLQDSLVFMQH